MILRSLFLFFLIVCLFNCKDEGSKTAHEKEQVLIANDISLSPERQKGSDLLDNCISAHGGMDGWNAFLPLNTT